MPVAEIITIGTEILLGEIVDTNARDIARKLRDTGIDLYRKTTVGDNPSRISQAIRQAMERSQIIITTGGLGPTVDDPTREAVAQAVDVELEFRPDLWEQVQARFRRYDRFPTENNRRQAYIPAGAQVIVNPVGTAPAFLFDRQGVVIISLPGVPREMEYLMDHEVIPYLQARFNLAGLIKSRILHTVGVGESQIDEVIADLETLSNPTVGLAAHSGQVDVRITVKAETKQEAEKLLLPVEMDLRKRLGDWIYGADADTLEGAALKALYERGWSLAVIEYGMGGYLIHRISRPAASMPPELQHTFKGGKLQTELTSPEQLRDVTYDFYTSNPVNVCLGAGVFLEADRAVIGLRLFTPEGEFEKNFSYGGPPEYAPRYAAHNGLDLLRKLAL